MSRQDHMPTEFSFIEDALKRAYTAVPDGELPDRFTELLARFPQANGHGADRDAPEQGARAALQPQAERRA